MGAAELGDNYLWVCHYWLFRSHLTHINISVSAALRVRVKIYEAMVDG